MSWYYKSVGKSAEHQMRLYTGVEHPEFEGYAVANIWNSDSKWQVEFLFDGDRLCGIRTNMGQIDCDYVLANINPDIIYGKMMPMEAILGMYQTLNPNVDGLFQAIATFNVPFTFAKEAITAAMAFVIYKPLSPILHGRKK